MNFLIDNAGFMNKGAELMLYSVMEKLNVTFYKPTFAVRANNPVRIAKLFELRDQKRQNMIPIKLLPSFITKNLYGFIAPKDIDIVLDAGGFRFGDQWESLYSEAYVNYWVDFYRKLKSKGKPIIFLPQAFGPFKKEISGSFMRQVFPNLDMVYVRDKYSKEYLEIITGKNSKIKIAPDFTSLYKPELSDDEIFQLKKFENRICIIPNNKMISHANEKTANNYFRFMVRLCKKIIELGESFFFINHEGNADERLIKAIITEGNFNVDQVSRLDANKVKWLIGKSKICITSRYHGLVSALSQGIPAFCTSWSHKYIALLDDYEIPEALLSLEDEAKSIKNILAILTNDNERELRAEKLKKKALIQKQLSEKMWGDISNLIRNGS